MGKKRKQPKEPVIITRRGKPIVELRPAFADPGVLWGSVTLRGASDLSRPLLGGEA